MKKNILINIFVTFIIGFVAGIAPFLFMKLLPNLLSSDLFTDPINYYPIVITGSLVGMITSILFAKSFHDKEPQDIFFYSLGIPAILIATISNFATEIDANTIVENNRTESSLQVIYQPPTIEQEIIGEPTIINNSANNDSISFNFWSGGKAWANTQNDNIFLAKLGNILVSIGEYFNENDAWNDYKKYQKTKLRSEKYFQKNLQVLKLGPSRYILVYSRHTDKTTAEKVYKILKINDPRLNINIFKY